MKIPGPVKVGFAGKMEVTKPGEPLPFGHRPLLELVFSLKGDKIELAIFNHVGGGKVCVRRSSGVSHQRLLAEGIKWIEKNIFKTQLSPN